MGAAETEDQAIVAAISEAIRSRTLATSARDVLPVPARTLGPAGERPRGAPARALAHNDKSMVAQVAARAVTNIGAVALEAMGLGILAPLLQSDVVRGVIAAAAEKAAKSPSRAARPSPVVPIWASNSAALRIKRDDLPKLIIDVPGIQDVYPNRRLFVPPLVTPSALPQAVVDSKASSWGLERVGALATWGAYDSRGKDVLVGLLDTGVDADHPDLKDKIARWAEFDESGAEVVGSKPHDTDLHGTHCAGTICGGRASGRWIGMAPEAKIAAALVLNGKKGGTDKQILAGLQWAIQQGVDVISMSLGGLTLGPDVPSTYTVSILNALRLGIPVVTAIGNDGSQTSGSPANDFFSFAIGATDHRDRAAGFSGGRTHVIRQSRFIAPENLPLVYSKPDISAPGVAVYSSIPGGKHEPTNGTSMATPHVAGAIALLLSATEIRERVEQANRAFLIQDLITGSVEELGETGQDHRFGFGRLDVLRAIGFARERGY
jgi:subtilisin family serine protease